MNSESVKLIYRNLNLIDLGDQQGALSGPANLAEHRRKNASSFPSKDPATEKPWILPESEPAELPLPLRKSALRPLAAWRTCMWLLTVVVLCCGSMCSTLSDPKAYGPPGTSVHVASPGKNAGVGCHGLL